MSIKEARLTPLGRVVSVTGSVSVPSGSFASSMMPGFALQDSSGGIYVSDGSRRLEVGERLTLTGVIEEHNGQKIVKLRKLEKSKPEEELVPRPVLCREITEELGGLLVRVIGKIIKVKADAPYGHKIFMDDGSGECLVFINSTAACFSDIQNWRTGDLLEVRGFVGSYNGSYEIMPINNSDLKKKRP